MTARREIAMMASGRGMTRNGTGALFRTAVLGLTWAVLVAMSAGIGISPASADLNKKYDPSRVKLPPLGEIPAIQPERYELPNGAAVYLLENHELPVVRGIVYFRSTSAWESADKVGLAAMTGQVMRSGGSASYPGDWLDDRLGQIGATISTSIGGDFATGSFRTLSEHAEEVVGLWANVLSEPEFPAEKIELAKIAQRRAIAARNDEMLTILQRVATQAVAGKDNPYVRNTEYATIAAVTRQDMQAFHQLCFAPERAVLAIYGDFDSATMKQWLAESLGAWPASGVTPPERPPFPEATERRIVFAQKDDVTQSAIVLAHPGYRADAPDAPDMDVVEHALGGGFSSRLFNRIRTERGLAYATGAQAGAGFLRPGVFLAYSLTQTDSTLTALGLLEEEVRRIVAEPITAQELQTAKGAAQASFIFNFEQPSQVLFRAAFYEAAGYPADFLETYNARLNGVSRESALAAAQSHILPDAAVVVIVGREEDFEDTLESIGLPVERVDLTIPPPPSAIAAEPATPEAMAKGSELLAAAAKTAGGAAAWKAVKAAAFERDATLSMQGQQIAVKQEQLWSFPDRRVDKLQLPFGEMVQASDGKIAWQTAMGQTRDEPKIAEQVRKDYASSLFRIFSEPGALKVQALSKPATVEGVECTVGLVQSETVRDWKLFFGPNGGLHAMEYQGEGPSGPATQRIVYSEWAKIGGIQYPRAQKTFMDGELFIESKVVKVELNPAIPQGSFQKPS